MDKEYTHIAMVIDRSGSMGSCWSDVKGGYAEIVKQNKAEPGKCTFTVAAFDTEYDLLEDFSDIQNVEEELSVNPRGGTALLDAIGKTIVSVGEKLAKLDEKNRPMKVICIVNTDGEENASKEFTKEAVKKLIDEQTNVYKWQFQFIGASLESVNEARSWGFAASNVSTYNVDNSLDTFSLLGEKLKSMRSATTYDSYVEASAFSEEDKVILNSSKS
jgi:uncharacterized protein YegL